MASPDSPRLGVLGAVFEGRCRGYICPTCKVCRVLQSSISCNRSFCSLSRPEVVLVLRIPSCLVVGREL